MDRQAIAQALLAEVAKLEITESIDDVTAFAIEREVVASTADLGEFHHFVGDSEQPLRLICDEPGCYPAVECEVIKGKTHYFHFCRC